MLPLSAGLSKNRTSPVTENPPAGTPIWVISKGYRADRRRSCAPNNRSAIRVIAALFLAGRMSGDHGVKRMAGAAARWHRRGRARTHGQKRQARDRGHGGWNHGGVVSRQRARRLARQVISGPHTASGAGDPSRQGALALAQFQYRQRRDDYANPHLQIGRRNLLQGIPTHCDRQRVHRASPRQRLPPARRRVAGTRRAPGTGETAVLWDGTGLVVKRVEVLPNAEPPRLRLISANPAYEPYTCLAQDAHIVGKVLWTLRRM